RRKRSGSSSAAGTSSSGRSTPDRPGAWRSVSSVWLRRSWGCIDLLQRGDQPVDLGAVVQLGDAEQQPVGHVAADVQPAEDPPRQEPTVDPGRSEAGRATDGELVEEGPREGERVAGQRRDAVGGIVGAVVAMLVQ